MKARTMLCFTYCLLFDIMGCYHSGKQLLKEFLADNRLNTYFEKQIFSWMLKVGLSQ